MTLRLRVLALALALVVLTVTVLSWGIRHEVERRLVLDFSVRVGDVTTRVQADLQRQETLIRSRLAGIAQAIGDDNRFRRGVREESASDRRYVIDYAGRAMAVTGLDVLSIHDAEGRIVSSGHFRNAFGSVEASLPRELAALLEGHALTRVRTPSLTFVAFMARDTVRLGSERLELVGGVAIDERFLDRLAGGRDVRVTLWTPEDPGGTGEAVESLDALRRDMMIPFITADGRHPDDAIVSVVHSREGLVALQADLRRWILVAAAATAAGALLLAWWFASRLSRPLATLAGKTAVLDLDRLDVEFATHRSDEVGRLARLLDGLVKRLRRSTGRLREAERRATVADVARQVNHDIKNGLTPIRNVFRHLSEVAAREPARLADVFAERHQTVESSITYLHDLATNYARLSPRLDRGPCDTNAIVRQIAAERGGESHVVSLRLARDLPMAAGDGVALRRVLENLIGNAVESLSDDAGSVTVTSTTGDCTVRVSIQDTGCGMTNEELEHAFDDFYTTKEHGTGLGLSVVRRLIADLGGTIQAQTEPGAGTTFVIEVPAR